MQNVVLVRLFVIYVAGLRPTFLVHLFLRDRSFLFKPLWYHICTTCHKIKELCICPECIYGVRMILRINNDYLFKQY